MWAEAALACFFGFSCGVTVVGALAFAAINKVERSLKEQPVLLEEKQREEWFAAGYNFAFEVIEKGISKLPTGTTQMLNPQTYMRRHLDAVKNQGEKAVAEIPCEPQSRALHNLMRATEALMDKDRVQRQQMEAMIRAQEKKQQDAKYVQGLLNKRKEQGW